MGSAKAKLQNMTPEQKFEFTQGVGDAFRGMYGAQQQGSKSGLGALAEALMKRKKKKEESAEEE